MNRPIKFRAKGRSDGQWHYGSLLQICDDFSITTNTEDTFEICNVFHETLGQFTGLLDCNGKEIYEGDIVLYGGSIQHEVMFRHGAFGYLIYGGQFMSYAGNPNFTFNPLNRSKEHEVIGNIHDNPELLKGGEQ